MNRLIDFHALGLVACCVNEAFGKRSDVRRDVCRGGLVRGGRGGGLYV